MQTVLYTYGNAQTVVGILNAVSAAVGDDSFKTLVHLFLLLSFMYVMGIVVAKQNLMGSFKWFASFYLLINILAVPKMTVMVEDVIDHHKVTAVDNVPLGLAYPAGLFSLVGYYLTNFMDELFSMPQDISYGETGYVMASKLARATSELTITNPDFSKNMSEFMNQCVFYDVLQGKYTITELFQTTDLLSFLTTNVSHARSMMYNNQIVSCQTGLNDLKTDLTQELDQSASILGMHIFGITNSEEAKSAFLTKLPIAMSYLTSISQSASTTMQQALLSNAVQSAIMSNGATLNTSAAVNEYANVRANELGKSKFEIGGSFALNWLPIMGNVILALFYALFIVVVPLMATPIGYQSVKYYILGMAWVQLWAPLYAVFNYIFTVSAGHGSQLAVSTATGFSLNLNTLAPLAEINNNMAVYAGYASLLIPVISYGIIHGGKISLAVLANQMASIGTQAAARASEEATTGNLSFGNTSFSNQSAFNTNRNHLNTNTIQQSGMVSYQTASGAMIHHTQDGSNVIDSRNAISSTGTTINYAESMRASALTQSDNALSQGLTHTKHFSEQVTNTVRSLYELGKSMGHGQSSDESYGNSESSQKYQSLENFAQHVDNFAKTHNVSADEAVRLTAQAYAKGEISAGLSSPIPMVKASVNGSLGVQASMDGSKSETLHKAYSDSENYSQNHSLKDMVDLANRASHDTSFKQHNDISNRLTSNIGNSYDKALSMRTEAVANLNEASSLRKVASYSQEHAASINTNAGQSFVNWLQAQPNHGGGRLGISGAEQIVNTQPELARAYANDFIKGEVARMESAYTSHSNPVSSFQSSFNQQSKQLSSEDILMGARNTMREQITKDAAKTGIEPINVSANEKEKTMQTLNQSKSEFDGMELSDHGLKKTVKEKIN